jgi:hypothetical protein
MLNLPLQLYPEIFRKDLGLNEKISSVNIQFVCFLDKLLRKCAKLLFLGNYGHYVPSAANANPCPAPPPAYSQVESTVHSEYF